MTGKDTLTDEELAAKRAEIAAKVAIARKQQEQEASSSNSGKKARSAKAAADRKASDEAKARKEKVRAALEEHKMPSSDQLRRNAREMSRNPAMVRRANPEMRNFTDAQIREQAKEMEKMAANPEMIDAMMKVQSMPESERTALNQLQEGLSGKVVRDDKWINDTIRLVKSQPETLKMLFKGRVPKDSPLSEKQLMSIVDYVVTLSDWVLVNSVHLINWGIRDGVAYYKKVDDLTFGCARWIVLVVMLVLMFYVAKLVWYIVWYTFAIVMSGYRLITNGSAATGAAGGADSANAATPEPSAIGKEQVFAEAPFVDLSSEL